MMPPAGDVSVAMPDSQPATENVVVLAHDTMQPEHAARDAAVLLRQINAPRLVGSWRRERFGAETHFIAAMIFLPMWRITGTAMLLPSALYMFPSAGGVLPRNVTCERYSSGNP